MHRDVVSRRCGRLYTRKDILSTCASPCFFCPPAFVQDCLISRDLDSSLPLLTLTPTSIRSLPFPHLSISCIRPSHVFLAHFLVPPLGLKLVSLYLLPSFSVLRTRSSHHLLTRFVRHFPARPHLQRFPRRKRVYGRLVPPRTALLRRRSRGHRQRSRRIPAPTTRQPPSLTSNIHSSNSATARRRPYKPKRQLGSSQ